MKQVIILPKNEEEDACEKNLFEIKRIIILVDLKSIHMCLSALYCMQKRGKELLGTFFCSFGCRSNVCKSSTIAAIVES